MAPAFFLQVKAGLAMIQQQMSKGRVWVSIGGILAQCFRQMPALKFRLPEVGGQVGNGEHNI